MSKHDAFYHVFLSFRGETRDKFTCFLHKALIAEGFMAFMDKRDIKPGDGVQHTIEEGIKNSMSAIIIFSPNYAESTCCLDELVLILNRMKSSRYFIIPIFYDVRSRDIRHQLGKYGLDLEMHRKRHGDKVVDKWRQALFEVGNILGKHVEGLHSIFIRRVVELFRDTMAAKFPELQFPTREPTKDKVILYTTNVCTGQRRTKWAKKLLASGNVVFDERNCSKDSMYLREVEELLGKDKVKLPMVIVNGKDLCGEEQVEGLDGFEYKLQLVMMLKTIYGEQSLDKSVDKVMFKFKDFFSC